VKLTTDRAAFAEALAWVATVVPKRPAVPTQAGIHLTAATGQLTIAAFNFDTAHTATIEADVTEAGEVVPSGHMLKGLVAALRGPAVTLAAEERSLVLTAGRARYSLNLFPAGEYPTAPPSPPPAGTFEADDLRRMLSVASYACDDGHPNSDVRGVRLLAEPERLVIVGAQSTTVAASWLVWADGTLKAHLPFAALSGAVAGMSGPVALGADGALLGLTSADRAVVTRLYADGRALNWQHLVPAETTVTATLESEELLGAVKRAGLAGGPGGAVRLRIAPEGVRVSASGDTATGAEELDVTDAEGEVTLQLTAELLAGALASAPPGEVTLRATEAGKPIVFASKAEDWVQVVMPRRAS